MALVARAKKTNAKDNRATLGAAARLVADRARQVRELRGLTQEVVAERAKLSAKFVGQVERGHANPSITVVAQLVIDGLGMTLSEFFADGRADDDAAAVSAIVSAQPPATRRRLLRIVRAAVDD